MVIKCHLCERRLTGQGGDFCNKCHKYTCQYCIYDINNPMGCIYYTKSYIDSHKFSCIKCNINNFKNANKFIKNELKQYIIPDLNNIIIKYYEFDANTYCSTWSLHFQRNFLRNILKVPMNFF